MQILRVLAATIVLATTGVVVAGADAGAISGASIMGAWMRTDGASRISVEPCGERFCAVNTWIKDPSKGEAVGDRLVMTLQPRDPVRLAEVARTIRAVRPSRSRRRSPPMLAILRFSSSVTPPTGQSSRLASARLVGPPLMLRAIPTPAPSRFA